MSVVYIVLIMLFYLELHDLSWFNLVLITTWLLVIWLYLCLPLALGSVITDVIYSNPDFNWINIYEGVNSCTGPSQRPNELIQAAV